MQRFCHNIATIQIFKFFAYFRIMFLQDSVFLYQKYPQNPFWNHIFFPIRRTTSLLKLFGLTWTMKKWIKTVLFPLFFYISLSKWVIYIEVLQTSWLKVSWSRKNYSAKSKTSSIILITGKVTFALSFTKICPWP